MVGTEKKKGPWAKKAGKRSERQKQRGRGKRRRERVEHTEDWNLRTVGRASVRWGK